VIQAALLTPVKAAQDQDTPAASPVVASLWIWGRNYGTAKQVAVIGV